MDKLKTHGKDVETAGKHDNDQRKSCKIHWKMLENTVKVQENVTTTRGNRTKTIGKWRRRVKLLETYIENVWKCRKPEEMMQKPMEQRGENGRKHVIKKCWTKHIENRRRGCIGKYTEAAGRHDNDQRKSCKIPWKWRKPERMLGTNRDDAVKMLEK